MLPQPKRFRAYLTDAQRPLGKLSPAELATLSRIAAGTPFRKKVTDDLNDPDTQPQSIGSFPKNAFTAEVVDGQIQISRVYRDSPKSTLVATFAVAAFSMEQDSGEIVILALPMTMPPGATAVADAWKRSNEQMRDRLTEHNKRARERWGRK